MKIIFVKHKAYHEIQFMFFTFFKCTAILNYTKHFFRYLNAIMQQIANHPSSYDSSYMCRTPFVSCNKNNNLLEETIKASQLYSIIFACHLPMLFRNCQNILDTLLCHNKIL